MADEKQSPLEIEGNKFREQLIPKNEFNVKNTAPLDEAAANKDPDAIGENGSKTDQKVRIDNLKKNRYSDKKQYPDW